MKQRKWILVSQSLIITTPSHKQALGLVSWGSRSPSFACKTPQEFSAQPSNWHESEKSCCTGKVNTQPGSRHETAKGCSSRIDIIGSTSQFKLAKDFNTTNKQPGSRYVSTKGSNKQKDIRAGKFKESRIVSTNNKGNPPSKTGKSGDEGTSIQPISNPEVDTSRPRVATNKRTYG